MKRLFGVAKTFLKKSTMVKTFHFEYTEDAVQFRKVLEEIGGTLKNAYVDKHNDFALQCEINEEMLYVLEARTYISRTPA